MSPPPVESHGPTRRATHDGPQQCGDREMRDDDQHLIGHVAPETNQRPHQPIRHYRQRRPMLRSADGTGRKDCRSVRWARKSQSSAANQTLRPHHNSNGTETTSTAPNNTSAARVPRMRRGRAD